MLLTLIILIALCVGLFVYSDNAGSTGKSIAALIGGVAAGFIMVGLLIGYCTSISSNYGFPQRFEAEKATITQMKQINVEFEKVKLAEKTADLNGQLASLKYWNKTFFGDTVPDEVDKLEPIK